MGGSHLCLTVIGRELGVEPVSIVLEPVSMVLEPVSMVTLRFSVSPSPFRTNWDLVKVGSRGFGTRA